MTTRPAQPLADAVPRRLLWKSLVADDAHGPLPLLLLGLTVVTGVVDAVSILALGRVFVANMTGNVVFVGFALAGASGFSLAASLSALGGFLVGAAIGGRAVRGLQVFDLTTTVLTMTLTGIAADTRQGDRFAVIRRLAAVGTMLGGAVVGAVLVLEVSKVAALGLATAIL